MSNVTLVFEDGRSVSLTLGAGDVVYQAALRNGVQLVTDCREGACATCKGRCTSGRYRHREFSEDALSPEEEAQGFVLTCQMQPETDCVVELPYPAEQALSRRTTVRHEARVTAVARIADNVVRLAVEFSNGEPAFLPGQYVKIKVPGADAVRSYSFANPPGRGGSAEFFVRLLEGGAMSEYLAGRAQTGEALEIEGALGHFYFRGSSRPVLMMAGGTGLAPMLSMLDHMALTGQRPERLTLLYGVNQPAEFFALDRLQQHATGLGLDLRLASVQDGGSVGAQTGRVTELFAPDLVGDGEIDAYLCGPPPMIVAGQSLLQNSGVPVNRIFAEKFTPST